MPPLLDSFSDILGGFKTALFGPQQQQGGRGTDTSTPERTASHRADISRRDDNDANADADGVEVVETTAPVRVVVGKRAREVEEQKSDAVKRKKQITEYRKSLVPDYRTQPNATAIELPTAEGYAQVRIAGRRTNMGAFKPVNTLNDDRHGSKNSRPGTPRPPPPTKSDFHKGGQLDTTVGKSQQLQTMLSKGSNVRSEAAPFNTRRGDGFVDGGPSKRQKTSHARGMPAAHSSDQVDLISDEEGPNAAGGVLQNVRAEEALAFARVRPSPAPSATQRSQPKAQPEQSELSRTNEMYKLPSKRRRPKRESQVRQVSPQRSSVVEIFDDSGPVNVQPCKATIDVSDSEPLQRAAPSKRRHIHQQDTLPSGTHLPRINLTKGFDAIGKPGHAQGTRADHDATAELMRSKMPQNAHQNRVDQPASWSAQRAARERLQPQPGALEPYRKLSTVQQRQLSPLLRNQFQRDEATVAKSTKQKAPQRMKATSHALSSRTSPVDDSIGSVDELAGETTVTSRASQSISRRKNVTINAGSESPSNIRPTNFQEPNSSHEDSATESQSERGEAEFRVIRVNAFYSASCVLSSGNDITLVYNGAANGIDVCSDGEIMRVVGKDRIVNLGKNEVRRVCYNPKSNHTVIKGSSSDVSRGTICIAFKTPDGIKSFMDLMTVVSDELTTFDPWERAELEKTFSNQCKELIIAYDRAKATVESRTAQKHVKGVLGLSRAPDDDEDEIKYESDTPKTQSLRRSVRGDVRDDTGTGQRVYSSEVRPRSWADSGATRRSTRERKPVQGRISSPSPERWTQVNKLKPWAHPVVYPPQGARRVTAEFNDLERLDEGQFLNDNVISFALRKIEEEMTPEHRESVHFFNTFFYTSLTTKNGKKAFNYDAVKKWTKNKDIFALPYVVVPINIDLHWFVAIIANLDKLNRKPVGMEEGEEASGEKKMIAVAQNNADGSFVVTGTRPSSEQPRAETEGMNTLSISDTEEHSRRSSAVFDIGEDGLVNDHDARDAGEDLRQTDEQSSRPSTATSKKGKKKFAPSLRKYGIDTPAVITLDSFGSQHTTETRVLKDYLVNEADVKRGLHIERDNLQGLTAKGIPQQTNFCDCGVYLIGYVEQFAKNPRGFVDKVLSRQLEQDKVFEDFDPSKKRGEIRDQLLQLNVVQEMQRKQAKRAKAAVGQTLAKPPTAAKAADGSTSKAPTRLPSAEAPAAKTAQPEQTNPNKPHVHAQLPAKHVETPRAIRTTKSSKTLNVNEATIDGSSTKHPLGTNDDDDKLETDVPRALNPATHAQHPRSTTAAQASAVDDKRDTSSSGSGEDDSDDSEMLDNTADGANDVGRSVDATAPLVDRKAATISYETPSLLSGLEDHLKDNVAKSENVAKTRRGATSEEPQRVSHQPSVDLDQESQRPAEIADSQEARKSASPQWTHSTFMGKRTIFN